VCAQAPSPDCAVACATAAECTDGDLCTTETCVGGICGTRASPTCAACTAATDCGDGNPCTVDVCGSSGSCELTAIAGCTVPPAGGTGTGGPGIDGPGTGGGGDPAGPVAETCGDCRDNDADGLVDFEDPDCCERTHSLTLRRVVMRADGLRLRSRPSATGMARLDPARDRVTLQLSDRDGQLYCQDLAFRVTKSAVTRGALRFTDKTGTRAAGLQRARLKIRTDGRMVFRAAGRKMRLRTPADSGVRVTLRAGGQCLQATAPLRARSTQAGTRHVFP
jgi:hypothetical protein